MSERQRTIAGIMMGMCFGMSAAAAIVYFLDGAWFPFASLLGVLVAALYGSVVLVRSADNQVYLGVDGGPGRLDRPENQPGVDFRW